MTSEKVECLVKEIATMDRENLIGYLRNLKLDFVVDFTDQFLQTISLERLKHIALAASLHVHEPVPARSAQPATN